MTISCVKRIYIPEEKAALYQDLERCRSHADEMRNLVIDYMRSVEELQAECR